MLQSVMLVRTGKDGNEDGGGGKTVCVQPTGVQEGRAVSWMISRTEIWGWSMDLGIIFICIKELWTRLNGECQKMVQTVKMDGQAKRCGNTNI